MREEAAEREAIEAVHEKADEDKLKHADEEWVREKLDVLVLLLFFFLCCPLDESFYFKGSDHTTSCRA